jgi:hypothetical protein
VSELTLQSDQRADDKHRNQPNTDAHEVVRIRYRLRQLIENSTHRDARVLL